MLTIAKFGGSSLADSSRFIKAAGLVQDDPARRIVVVSAPGKRDAQDVKLTDQLYACHRIAKEGGDAAAAFAPVRQRFLEILDGCGLSISLDSELDQIEARLGESPDYAASRGEYLSARVMAALLGYSFVDAADWIRFCEDGTVDEAQSKAALQELVGEKPAVIPGFYGLASDGTVHTFSRGGSDITGALAAAYLGADLYENWTDVCGVLDADPQKVPEAKTIPHLRYDQLQEMADAGAQVFHPDAVAPVQKAGIPTRIACTFRPEHPGTWID